MSLENYQAIAESIALLLYPHAEVVVHDLRTQTVVHIANNISKRSLGDDSAIAEDLDDLLGGAKLGPYEKLNWNGQKVRSISTVLRDEQGDARHLMCINLDLPVLENARHALEAFFQMGRLVEQPQALFRDDWQERINTFMHAWLKARHLSLQTMQMGDKRSLVQALHAEGAFEGRSGVDYVANVLNMGRATVYRYLKALRRVHTTPRNWRALPTSSSAPHLRASRCCRRTKYNRALTSLLSVRTALASKSWTLGWSPGPTAWSSTRSPSAPNMARCPMRSAKAW